MEIFSEIGSGKVDCRMSQVSQLTVFVNVLPVSLCVSTMLPHSSLLCVNKTLIYINADYHFFLYHVPGFVHAQGHN